MSGRFSIPISMTSMVHLINKQKEKEAVNTYYGWDKIASIRTLSLAE